MRRFFILISFAISFFAYADSSTEAVKNLLDLNQTLSSDESQFNFLRGLRGDTITFDITAYNHVDLFTKEIPDTIWVKKRPKKNPQEGKHYKLSYIYKGVPYTSDSYSTPTSAINGKPFAVLSVDQIAGDRYSIHKDLSMKLIDLEDLSVVNCHIPHNLPYGFTISSNRVKNRIKSLIGQEFYIKAGTGFSTPEFKLGKLASGDYSIIINNNSLSLTINSNVHLNFIDESGTPINFKYERPLYGGYSSREDQIISKEEHEDRYIERTIDSNVNDALADTDIAMPFSFNYIFGLPNSYSAHMSQTIDPSKVNSYSWYSGYHTAPEKVMFVGGCLTVRGKRFLKMIHNGKAFFMKEDDVKLLPDAKTKLDSLRASSPEIQDIFFNKNLSLSKAIYYDKLGNALNELNAYKKYGLAIRNWGVYDESEYTDGTSIRITFFNPTAQTIKYISISFQGYNSVDDPYGHPVTKKCIGPIDPDETASYNFEYVWFTDVVEYAKIRSIIVTYKNGTTKTISNANSIMLTDDIIDTLFKSDPVSDFK